MSTGPTVRVDLRAALPVVALAIVVLAIIVVQLCGRDEVKAPATQPTPGPTATAGPTFTPGPSPTLGPATETPTGEAPQGDPNQRDAVRVQDITAIQQALELFRSNEGEYPNTNGNIQTLCVFEDSDAGCDLRDVLDQLPQDPLGDPSTHGYFYASDGQTYTLYATREGDQIEECSEHPEHLGNIDSLYCVRGP